MVVDIRGQPTKTITWAGCTVQGNLVWENMHHWSLRDHITWVVTVNEQDKYYGETTEMGTPCQYP